MQASPSFVLGVDEVHVWWVDLASLAPRLGPLGALLSTAERERAERLRFEVHRRRFVLARGALRSILAGYTGRDPGELAFVEGAHGKPSLDGDGPRFNVSHSEHLLLCAVVPRGTPEPVAHSGAGPTSVKSTPIRSAAASRAIAS